MSLDIYVTNMRTGEQRSMNWLRNPYGLCNWAEANYDYRTERKTNEESSDSLWYAINHWCYDTSEQVDKALFLAVVKRYGQVLLHDLPQGYFFFNERALDQFVKPHFSEVPKGIAVSCEKHKEYGIPMEYFTHLSTVYRPDEHTLKHYQEWYAELVAFAELLRDPDSRYYCSN